MKTSSCLFSPATALARIFCSGPSRLCVDHGGHLRIPRFLAPLGSGGGGIPATMQPRQPMQSMQPMQPMQPMLPASRRFFHGRPPVRRPPASGAAGTTRPKSNAIIRSHKRNSNSNNNNRGGHGNNNNNQAKFKLGRLPRDDEISHRFVVLRQEDGSLSEPRLTDAVRAELNRRTHSLVVLALPQAPTEEGEGDGDDESLSASKKSGAPRFPICKVVDRVAERKVQAEKARELRRKTVSGKELELNWAIDPHDLGHRLVKLEEFLARGLRVEVTLLRKGKGKGRRQATQDEAAAVVARIRETVAGVPGARETKPMEGQLLRTVKLFIEGVAKE